MTRIAGKIVRKGADGLKAGVISLRPGPFHSWKYFEVDFIINTNNSSWSLICVEPHYVWESLVHKHF